MSIVYFYSVKSIENEEKQIEISEFFFWNKATFDKRL